MFFIALAGPVIWAFVNHIDKFLLSKYFKVNGVGALMIFSTLFAVVVLPIVYIIDPTVVSVPLNYAVILIISGLISALSIYLYMKCLETDDASQVVPFFQTIPVFGYILSYIFLHEVISMNQTLSVIVIMIGAVILSIDFETKKKSKIKFRLVGLILLSSFLFALQRVIFKYVAIEESYLLSTFWENIGLLIFGCVLLFHTLSRNSFIDALKKNSKQIIGLNIFSEAATVAGNLLFSYATLLAPLVLVLTVEAYQPLIVLIIGFVVTKIRPDLILENISRTVLLQRSIAVIFMIIGGYLTYF